ATLTRLATNEKLWEAGVTRQQRTHAGVPYYTFTLPRQLNLAPSYVVADGVLLAAARPEFIVQAIDARKQGKTFPVQRPAPAHLALHVDDSALLKILLRNVRDELPEKAKLLLPDLDALLAGLSGYTATMQREANGVLIESRSDLGTTGAIIIAGVLGDQGHAVVAKRVEGDFARIAKALEAHRTEHAAYPDTLDALVPKFLPELNGDRFEPKRAYGYRHVADAWVITSVGPNKRADIPVDAFNPPVWHAAHQSQDPEQIAKLKRRVYQFRKEQFKDETKHDDEGDLVRMGGPGLTAAPAPLKPQEAAP
ncbi:hypothetical protein HQ560_15345, partial [bacterium]|nr:hypothetical protein [bacterium]